MSTPRTTGTRVSPDSGLTMTETTYEGDDGKLLVNERSETFVVEFIRNGKVNGRKGETAFLWRIVYLRSDYTGAQAAGRVTLNGFTEHGSTIGFNSDEEAAQYVKTVRNPDGTVKKASDHPNHERASTRYAQNMSY